jgi:hypothetical protein
MNFILLILLVYLAWLVLGFIWGTVLAVLFVIGAMFSFTGITRAWIRFERWQNFSIELVSHKIGGKQGRYFSKERNIEALLKIYESRAERVYPIPGPEATPYDRLVFDEDQESYDYYEAKRRLTAYGKV